MQPTRLPRKKDVALALLEQATVYVHLDPRGEAVRVPAWFKRQPQLVLQVGLNMPVPITDLQVDDDGVSCTLSFNRSPHFCVLPWTAVFALVGENGRGMVWPDDVPAEVAAEAEKQAKQQKAKAALQVAPAPVEEPAVAAAPKKKKKAKAKDADTAAATSADAKPAKAAPAAKAAPSGAKRAATAKSAKAEPKKKAVRAAKPQAPVAPVAAPALAAKAATALAEPAPKAASGGGEKRKRELPPYLRVVK